MITLQFLKGRGYLIHVSALPDHIEILYNNNITDREGFLKDYHPDVVSKIQDLIPTEPIKITAEVKKFFKAYKKISQMDITQFQPSNLKLASHQIENIKRTLLFKKIINADDTGLGKTISTIGFLNVLYNIRPDDPLLKNLLIIVPASLIDKWLDDFHNFSNIPIKPLTQFSKLSPLEMRGLFMNTPYKIVSIDTFKHYYKYLPLTYDVLIIDEIHNVKNRKTFRATSIGKINAPYKVFISATPLINQPEELHFISKLLNPSLLGDLYSFEDEFYEVKKFTLPNGVEARKIISIKSKTKNKLQHIIGSFITRHTWEEVGQEIPTQFHVVQKPLNDVQMELYDYIKRKYYKAKGIEILTYLQELCNSPLLLNKKLFASNFYIKNEEHFYGWKTDYLNNEFLDKLLSKHEQILIFTMYQKYVNLLYKTLSTSHPDIKIAKITGETSQKKRTKIIHDFQHKNIDVIIGDDALSFGQDLQTASALINMDLPFSPAIYDQRVGRIKRMGQENSIEIYDFISVNTIEEDKQEIIKTKRAYFEDIVNETRKIQETLYKHLSSN